MKIAVIGTGIAGNIAAYKLRDDHDITVFEAANYVGGHTNTIDVHTESGSLAIDTGFIVFNDRTYPNFIRILDEIGQASQASEMSFSVTKDNGQLEYNGASLNALFAQRRNILRPPFYRMVRDILRFNGEAVRSLVNEDQSQTIGRYLLKHGYSQEFLHCYLVPMAAAIWSSQPQAVADMPMHFLVRFFDNHGLLRLRDRPTWRVIKGGSREYVSKLVAGHLRRIRLNSAVRQIRRFPEYVEVYSEGGGRERFDAVFIATHSDQALSMLADPTRIEADILGAIRFQENEAILHTDVSLMPKRRRAWAAWNYHLPEDPGEHVAVTYNMNILQGIDSDTQYCVTLNNDQQINGADVIRRIRYQHPVYSREAIAAQSSQDELNGKRTFFCGAYWRNGFHEDGVVSALSAVRKFEEELRDSQLYLRRAG